MAVISFAWHEIIGHIGTLFIVLGVMQNNIKRVRIFMFLGSLSFVIYGIIISAWPVVIANIIVGLVSLYYLFKVLLYEHKKI